MRIQGFAMDALERLQEIPGVGPSIARDLYDLGFRQVSDLANKEAEAMYENLQNLEAHLLTGVSFMFSGAQSILPVQKNLIKKSLSGGYGKAPGLTEGSAER